MKSIFLKTLIASASVIILGSSAYADQGYKYGSGDSCNTTSHSEMKYSPKNRSVWGAPSKSEPRQVWGPQGKKVYKNAGFLIIDGKKKSVDQYFKEVELQN